MRVREHVPRGSALQGKHTWARAGELKKLWRARGAGATTWVDVEGGLAVDPATSLAIGNRDRGPPTGDAPGSSSSLYLGWDGACGGGAVGGWAPSDGPSVGPAAAPTPAPPLSLARGCVDAVARAEAAAALALSAAHSAAEQRWQHKVHPTETSGAGGRRVGGLD
jgi:hypothetical protein